MRLRPAIANTLWTASNVPAYRRFRHALKEPHIIQRQKLHHLLKHNANTAFGKAYSFARIGSYEEFTRRVPLCSYAAIEPWVARIRHGETNVLTHEPVTHLIPTSGSSGARKLIPFTAGLQREFNAAIGPWLVDLARQFPVLIGGPAYWSITPALGDETAGNSAVPIGFAADTSYLGGARRKLADAVMAVPSSVGRVKSLDAFRYQTLLHLLLCRELRLISVWHPSFLTLLLDALPSCWNDLLGDIERGTESTRANPKRARELGRLDCFQPQDLWPALRIISCWADGAATLPMEKLRERFPGLFLQAKGLVATEAFVTLPFDGQHPLAVCSHFFEFIDDDGRTCTVDALQQDGEYEIVVTTSGGLWRYRLGDRVRVVGWVGKTPSLKFLGRGEAVSDRFGEKLSEQFIAETLREIFREEVPRFAMLAPDEDEQGCRYTLYVEGVLQTRWATLLDDALRRNPHYDYCRNLQQLLFPRIFIIHERGFELFSTRQASNGGRLGDIKPAALSRTSGWSQIFAGRYS
jgi:hypothetical protein